MLQAMTIIRLAKDEGAPPPQSPFTIPFTTAKSVRLVVAWYIMGIRGSG